MDIVRAPQKLKISQLRSAVLVATGIFMGFVGTVFIVQLLRGGFGRLAVSLVGGGEVYEHVWFGLSVLFVMILHVVYADWLRKAPRPKKVF
jgi:hypothetical protein